MSQLANPFRDPLDRRALLRAGALALGGWTLADLLRARALGAARGHSPANTSVILLWLEGGPSHLETYDLKPDAPVEYRGVLEDIATSMPGTRFCETVPALAKIADQLAIVRNFSNDSDDHLLSQLYTLSGR